MSVQQDEMTLSDALNKTIIDLTASPVFGAPDSTTVTKAVTGLEPSIVTLLDKIIDKIIDKKTCSDPPVRPASSCRTSKPSRV
ncbi:uncharacterized protein NFIA_114360 [Aspergillus fischeri NRRL 181]|uniref:Uncharacterized protein n=1 Tax=Neosartorya fischeri (strain ATCC 1020 / DSM 3700 / CBS 544.65 / FGSC A1164 / JCM 1740 / NRRL 181 / WB 181) TaxID=331117 RepID=A1D943_NEOFI|nr:uncharacterized protein NFIA_114360 [Aspergillus fischeri NRRL 181]EAW20904.1 hypothetical protein NFIA_114360 [Aspergillus fischeri NRRL 181]